MNEDRDGGLGSKCIFRHDLGDDVIMNMVSSPNDLCTIAAGIGSFCQLLQIKKNGASFMSELFSCIPHPLYITKLLRSYVTIHESIG